MKFNVTIDTGEMSIDRFIEWIYRAMDENSANDNRAWLLFELGHCNSPDSAAVIFGNDILREIRSQLTDMLGNEEDEDDQRTV